MVPLLLVLLDAVSPNWSTILMTSIVMVSSILVNALVVGVYIGRYQREQQGNSEDIKELKPLVYDIKSAFEAYTGRTVTGANYRNGK